MLLPKDPKDATTERGNVKKFFDWAYKAAHGIAIADSCSTCRCRPAVQTAVRAAWHSQVMADGKPVY